MTEGDRPLFTEDTGQRDLALVERVLAGDTAAFDRLVRHYERAAVGSAYRILGNRDDAQEVAQEAFLRAYRSLDRLKEPSRFGPWLMRIVCNLSLNARRSRASATKVGLDEQQLGDELSVDRLDAVSRPVAPDRSAEGKELQQALNEALESLPDKQRMSLVLFAMEGWAQKDIAELLECTVENVKWNVFQARKRLRDRLGDQWPG